MLEGPQVCAHAAETDLHLVGDAQRALRPGEAMGLGEVARWEHHLSTAATDALGDERCRGRQVGDAGGVGRAVAPEPAAVWVGQFGQMGVRGCAATALAVELVGTDVDAALGVAVVAPVDGDDVAPSRGRAGDAQCQLIGLAARVHEVDHAERVGKQPRQSLGVVEDGAVQVARVGVQYSGLPGDGLGHVWVRVTHVRHVVDGVEMGTTGVVDQPRALAAHDAERPSIADAE